MPPPSCQQYPTRCGRSRGPLCAISGPSAETTGMTAWNPTAAVEMEWLVRRPQRPQQRTAARGLVDGRSAATRRAHVRARLAAAGAANILPRAKSATVMIARPTTRPFAATNSTGARTTSAPASRWATSRTGGVARAVAPKPKAQSPGTAPVFAIQGESRARTSTWSRPSPIRACAKSSGAPPPTREVGHGPDRRGCQLDAQGRP